MAGGRVVFTIEITDATNGTFEVTINGQIDHPTHTTDTGSNSDGLLEETLGLDLSDGDAADVGEAAGGDRRQQMGHGRAGSETDGHSALDQLRSRFGGDSLLVIGPSHGRNSIRPYCFEYASAVGNFGLSRARENDQEKDDKR